MFNVWSGKKYVLIYFQDTRIKSLKNYFLTSGVVKMCFDAFALTLPDHQNQVLKKDIFLRLEWLKTCFDAFPGHQYQVLRKIIF
jgi:hypothetical protein